jgi:hypothetical protein
VLYESQGYDPNSGRVLAICATTDTGNCDGNTANNSYIWDTYANLVERGDTLHNVTENFCYDALNRLTNYAINGSGSTQTALCTSGTTNTVKSVSYDALGDILTKSDWAPAPIPPQASRISMGIQHQHDDLTRRYRSNSTRWSTASVLLSCPQTVV